MTMAAIYAHVSTQEKNTDRQLRELREFAERMGYEVTECVEKESSVKHRPVFEQMMMSDARRKRFDTVSVWKIDRFARSTQQFVNCVTEFGQLRGLCSKHHSEHHQRRE